MNNLIEKDLKYIWHPYTQMQTAQPPVEIVKAEKAYLYDAEGNKIIDAISSWWTVNYAHCHPYIVKKIQEQLQQLDHVIFAGFTHPKAVELAEKLIRILPSNQAKVFYSDNGSTAVEVAVKMAIQYWQNKGDNQRRTLIAIEGAYHGDTFGAMSVSARSAFNRAFERYLFQVEYIPFPTTENIEAVKQKISLLCKEKPIAFIYEPLVQGAAGMRMYSKEILNELLAIVRQHQVLCIADEVFTGFGRTGKKIASDYLNVSPDIMCFSKGLTGGFLPMGVTSCSQEIFDAFLSKEDVYKTFFHGHSFTGNPVQCAAAAASIDVLNSEETAQNIERIHKKHLVFLQELKKFKHIKAEVLGTILRIEFLSEESSYFHHIRNKIYQFFMKNHILIRPLGNVFYLLPPYCITDDDLDFIYQKIEEFLSQSNI